MVVILPVSLRLRVPCCWCPLSHLVSNQDGHFPSVGLIHIGSPKADFKGVYIDGL